VIISADRYVPLQVVVKTMDALRGEPSRGCKIEDRCLFDRITLSAGVE
jgi:hypothetical protein